MGTIQKLADYFSRFPGIGPRQAKRFVYFLLLQDKKSIDELANLLQKLKEATNVCVSCYRYFTPEQNNKKTCSICSDQNRSDETLMVVEKDVDLENIETSSIYHNKYFVLGNTILLLEKNPQSKIRSRELSSLVEKRAKEGSLKEVILALSATPDGEETSNYIVELLSPLVEKFNIKISHLGRGLSTGSELEYSDQETIKSAFQSRV